METKETAILALAARLYERTCVRYNQMTSSVPALTMQSFCADFSDDHPLELTFKPGMSKVDFHSTMYLQRPVKHIKNDTKRRKST